MSNEAKLEYLPVISGKGGYVSTPKTQRRYAGKDLGWWMDNPLYRYDSLLISAYYGMEFTRKDLNIRDNVKLFGDSGGFQIYHLGQDNPVRRKELQAKLSPPKIIKWQQEICDIGMTLDLPLPEFHDYSEAEFQHHMKVSKEQGDLMRSLHTNKNFQLFDVVHGRNINDLTRWWKGTTADYDFDGFSLDAGNLKTVAMDLGFAIEHLEGAPFHILGASGFQALILMVYANKYMKTTLYYDSSSYNTGNTLRKYINFFDISGGGLMFGEKESENRPTTRMDKITCPCPVCREITDPSHLWDNGTQSGTLLSLHNLFWYVNYTEFLEELLKNEQNFKDYIQRNGSKQTKMYIEFIDMVAEKGLDVAYTRYFDKSTQQIDGWL